MCSDRNAANHQHSMLQNGKENRYTPPGRRPTVTLYEALCAYATLSPLPFLTYQLWCHAPSNVGGWSLDPQRQQWSNPARTAEVPTGDGESQHLPWRSAPRATHRHLQRSASLTQPVA